MGFHFSGGSQDGLNGWAHRWPHGWPHAWIHGARSLLAAVRSVRGGPGSRFVRELVRVERVELQRCLLEAASRRLRARARRGWVKGRRRPSSAATTGVFTGSDPSARGDWFERLAQRPGWRRRARAILWLRLGSGCDHEEYAFLAELLDLPVADWPQASTILEHTRLVADGPATAHAHARALEIEGRVEEARRLFVRELDRPGGVRRLARGFEAVARLHRASGRRRLALAPFVEHGHEWPFDATALVEALVTAIEAGDGDAARRVAIALAPRAHESRARAAFERAAGALMIAPLCERLRIDTSLGLQPVVANLIAPCSTKTGALGAVASSAATPAAATLPDGAINDVAGVSPNLEVAP